MEFFQLKKSEETKIRYKKEINTEWKKAFDAPTIKASLANELNDVYKTFTPAINLPDFNNTKEASFNRCY